MATPLSTPVAFARNLLAKDSTTLTDAIAVTFANDALLRFRSFLIEKNSKLLTPTSATLSITSAHLTTGGTPGIFTLAADFWKMKVSEISWTTPTDSNTFVPIGITD